MTPWRSMWLNPKETIRWIVQTNPRYGVFWLSSIYVLQSTFFFLNFWSLGLAFSHDKLWIPSVLIAPFLGVLWVCFYGWILRSTGRWFGGKAPPSHIRAALAWSRLPMSLALAFWIFFLLWNPEEAFIQQGPGNLAPLYHLFFLTLGLWSLFLFVQALREVQHFSILKALANIFVSRALYSVIVFSLMLILRFLSTYFPHTSA